MHQVVIFEDFPLCGLFGEQLFQCSQVTSKTVDRQTAAFANRMKSREYAVLKKHDIRFILLGNWTMETPVSKGCRILSVICCH